MPEEPRQIFREKSLEKLSSPDRLDQLLRIVKPQSWILVTAFAGGIALALVWSFLGRVPATAQGTAILVRPKQVVSFQSPASGRVASIEVAVGDTIQKGALLARLHVPTLQTQLDQEKAKLRLEREQSAQLVELKKSRDQELAELQQERAKTELAYIAEERRLMEERIANIERSAREYEAENTEYLQEQGESIQVALALSKELATLLQKRYEAYEKLAAEDLNTEDALVEPRSRAIDNELRQAELDVKRQELKLREILARETIDQRMDVVQDLYSQIRNLRLREMEISGQLREFELQSRGEILEMEARNRTGILDLEARIAELESRLETESRVVSEHDGTVLEVTSTLGQQVTIGQRLGKMEIEDASSTLMAVAYFPIKDGKKIGADSKIRISPSTVERQRWGSMVGKVTRVSQFPVTVEAAANQVGDQEIAKNLLRGEPRIEVMASLDPDTDAPTGFAWTSGHRAGRTSRSRPGRPPGSRGSPSTKSRPSRGCFLSFAPSSGF